ncbi:MAG: hypothetical protein K6F39_01800 [Lachnospiraceae bacterium]|nr:hypothetical protein [Lachnospiraceae bacterium]
MTLQMLMGIMMIPANLILYFLFGSLITARRGNKDFSISMTVLTGFFVYYCLFDIPCLVIMLNWRPLSWLGNLWGVLMGIICIISCIFNHKVWKDKFSRLIVLLAKHKAFAAAVIVIVAAQLAIILNAYQFTLDAAYYVANVTTSLQTNTMNIYDPYTGDWLNHFEMRYLFATYPMNDAVWCYLTGIHPLLWTKTIMAGTALVISNIIYYRIALELFGRKTSAIGSMLFFAGVVNFFYISIFTSSNFMLTRTYEGKSLIGNIVMPMIIYIFIKLNEEHISRRFWRLLFLVCLGSTILSNSANMLVPAMVGVFGLPLAIRKRSIKVIVNCLICIIPCVILLLAYVGYVKGLFVFYTYPPLFGKH